MQIASIKKKYNFGIRWNTVELLITQGLYLLFQFILNSRVPSDFFIRVNTQIALIFFIISFTSLGFSQAIFVFFKTYSQSRYSFKKFFIPQIIFQIIITIFAIFIMFLLKKYINFLYPLNFAFTTISTILFFESIKKIFRTTIQVFFKNNITAIVEILTYSIFFCLFVFFNINPITSLAIVSVVSFVPLCIAFVYTYYSLPLKEKASTVPISELFRQRLLLFSYRLTYIIPSGNLIVPLLIPYFSGPTAVVIYFLKNSAGFLRAFSEKVLGINTASLIARIKGSQTKEKEEAISYSLKRIYNIINLLIISIIPLLLLFLFENNIFNYCLSPYLHNAIFIILLIEVMPMLFVPQEKYLIIEDKVPYLVLFKVVNLFSIYFLVKYLSKHTTTALLLSVAIQLILLLFLNQIIEKTTNTNIIYTHVKYLITLAILACFITVVLITYIFC